MKEILFFFRRKWKVIFKIFKLVKIDIPSKGDQNQLNPKLQADFAWPFAPALNTYESSNPKNSNLKKKGIQKNYIIHGRKMGYLSKQ